MAIATVTAEGFGATDRLLSDVVARLQAQDLRIVGALRHVAEDGTASHCDSDLWLLPDGPAARITQQLGPGSHACRMDASAMEDAACLASSRLSEQGADLVVLNKFGLSEAEGRGFRTMIAEAVVQGVPVLIGVSQTHRAAFERFADGLSVDLQSDAETVFDWCRAAIHQTKASPEASAMEIAK
ncbi:DUF2478 domain-containing protein [Phaeovulum vinaykumarii]|uniref:Nucleoside-triphosphatase THEP1 n=1 Tax=Phaeovulum vinaykumarii TaxID=407234 RepID=A0A1N7LRG5_9RHOB|nr:DUF2478 domain-containing protein [Phaeovulum vinaykumarii]SIS76443.1 Protein of unknown function [Phaeovulum vinaykumarii]SOC07854.1 uncharacterized protein DUF2478 [Phaeovulum vinaykumarii]